MTTYEGDAATEKATMSKMNENVPSLALTENNFIDNVEIQNWDGANAFPEFSWTIVQPLISPSQSISRQSRPLERKPS